MEKILPISLKLNFTPNTLGCYGLSDEVDRRGKFNPRNVDCRSDGVGGWFKEGELKTMLVIFQEVEPMNKESDHIHIIALSSALNVGVRVRYMDRGDSSEVIAHDFPEGCSPAIHLLYRPGHYDILYL